MRRALPWVLFVVTACGGEIDPSSGVDAPPGAIVDAPRGGGPDAPGGVGEPAELAGITLAHNEARAAVGVPPLTWDPALAAIATAWVKKCTDVEAPAGLVDHNAGRSTGYPTYVGENIYASSGTATGPGAVASWISEKNNYDYASNTCASGKICGHYTQVVWKNTTKVGCALYNCSGLTYSSTVVCDYGPGGNDGGKPY